MKLKLLLFIFVLISLNLFSETYKKGKVFSCDDYNSYMCGTINDVYADGNFIYMTAGYGVLKLTREGKYIGWSTSFYYYLCEENCRADVIVKNTVENRFYMLNQTNYFYRLENVGGEIKPFINLRKYSKRFMSFDIDKNGKYYFSDMDHGRILVFSKNLEYIGKIGSKGTEDSSLQTPIGIRVKNGRLYVADSSSHSVKIFSTSDGSFIKKIGGFEKGENLLFSPVDVGVDKDENIYIYDRLGKKVKKFNSSGAYLLEVKLETGDFRKIFVENNGNFWMISGKNVCEYIRE